MAHSFHVLYPAFRSAILNNRYFFIPFIIWVVAGACCLVFFSRRELFFAINSVHSPFLDWLNTFFSLFGRGDVIAVLLCAMLLFPVYRNRNYLLTCIAFGSLFPLLIHLAKVYFNFPRPLTCFTPDAVHTVTWLDNLYWQSFPSGHTFGAFGFFLLLSLYLPAARKPWAFFFFMMALACGYSRIYLGQHFFADVYAGSIAGTVLALLIYLAGQVLIPPSSSKHYAAHE